MGSSLKTTLEPAPRATEAVAREPRILRVFAHLANLTQGLAALRKPSLQRITTRLHREHLRRNVASAGLRHGSGRRMLAFVRRHWRVSLLVAIALYGVVGTITALVPPTDYGPQIPGDLADYFRDLQTINLALLGAQATLLGLVYPLVIALVGMLFETRSSTGHRLQIYFSETEAASVGGLALTYIAFVALQSLLYAQLELKVVGAITVLNVIWFAINLLGLAFFVLRSLDFIQPTRRVRLTRSYIANIAWRDQLRGLMLANRWVNAARYKYLPEDAAESEFTITPFISDADLVAREFSSPRRLRDIRFTAGRRARYRQVRRLESTAAARRRLPNGKSDTVPRNPDRLRPGGLRCSLKAVPLRPLRGDRDDADRTATDLASEQEGRTPRDIQSPWRRS